MVQLGNFHIRRGETAKTPSLDSGEAFLLWDHLVSRYDIIEMTQIFQNFVHDPEFALVLKKGLTELKSPCWHIVTPKNRLNAELISPLERIHFF